MSTVDARFGEVESLQFSAEMNLAAGKKLFLRQLRTHPTFGHLREIARTTQGRAEISSRISALAGVETDARFEHPNDVAFCAYLAALDEAAEPDTIAESARIVQALTNCSWSSIFTRELLMRVTPTGQVVALAGQIYADPVIAKSGLETYAEWLKKFVMHLSVPTEPHVVYTPPMPPSSQVTAPQQLSGRADIAGSPPRGRSRSRHSLRQSSSPRKHERRLNYAR